MQNAVIYARFSSHGQNEQTIEGQIRVCKEYAAAHGLNIIAIYQDKHRTGTNDSRPDFQRMVADSASGAFQYVIVYMLERLNRNRYNSTIYGFQLAQNGVKVISATENISDSEEGEFYKMFLEWQAERYSKTLSKRVKEGLTTSVERGTFGGGHLIYGYKKIGADGGSVIADKKFSRRLVIDEDAAGVVRYMYKRYAEGASKKEIAEELNEQGRRYNGKPYKGRNLDRILTNRKYTGTFEFGGRECDTMYPQIISVDLYDKVQKRLAQNKYFAGANSARIDYLLQGKIFCGHCGESMVAGSGTSKTGSTYHYYSCNGRIKRHICHKTNEKKEELERYVVIQTVAYLSDARRVDIIAGDVIAYYENRTDAREIKRLTAERAKTQKEIDNAVNLLVSGVTGDTVRVLNQKINELSQLLSDLTAQQEQKEAEQKLRIRKSDIVAFIQQYIAGDINDQVFKKRIIDKLINAVYVYDNGKYVIYFNIHAGAGVETPTADDTRSAISDIGAESVLTLTRSARQARQCLNTPTAQYIFVHGAVGIVLHKEKGNQ